MTSPANKVSDHSRHIGIFGGSFNPVHIGHTMVASYIAQWCGLDEVWLMMSPQNPLKAGLDMAHDSHRMDMLRIAAGTSPIVKACGFELSMPRPSYTIDTLRALKAGMPSDRFSLIIGSDNWLLFDRWRCHDEILKEFGIIIYPRPGYPVPDRLPQGATTVNAPECSLSSTMIRETVASGRDASFFLPHGVFEYITKHRLYGCTYRPHN